MKRSAPFLLIVLSGLAACGPALPAEQTPAPPTAVVIPSATATTAASTKAPESGTADPDLPPDVVVFNFESPDGEWIATTTLHNNLVMDEGVMVRLTFSVRHAHDGRDWALVDAVIPDGLGIGIPTPIYWSADGNRIIVIDEINADGCGLFVYGENPRIVDLTTGAIAEMWPAVIGQGTAISLDGQWMAATHPRENELTLQLLNLLDQSLREFVIGDAATTQAGGIVFAPDVQALAFTAASNPCSETWMQSITHLNLATFEQRVLWGPSEERLRSIEWTADGILLVDPASVNAPLLLDPASGETRAGPAP